MVTGHPNVKRRTQAAENAVGSLHTKMGGLSELPMENQSAGGLTSPLAIPRTRNTLYTSVPSVETLTTLRRTALETDYHRIVTPYNTTEWSVALNKFNLQSKYPNLVHDIVFGSPIGNPPPLTYTFIPNNMASADEHSNMVDKHFQEEIAAGRLSGPYTIPEASLLFHGHFRTAPIGYIEKPPGCGKWRMIRNLSAKDPFGIATNDWLDASENPIMWHSCSTFADLVSLYYTLSAWGVFIYPDRMGGLYTLTVWRVYIPRPHGGFSVPCPHGRSCLPHPLNAREKGT
jgi:hypothetical protein